MLEKWYKKSDLQRVAFPFAIMRINIFFRRRYRSHRHRDCHHRSHRHDYRRRNHHHDYHRNHRHGFHHGLLSDEPLLR